MVIAAIMLLIPVLLWVVWLFLDAFVGPDITLAILRGVVYAGIFGSVEFVWKKYQRERAELEQRISELEKKVYELSRRDGA